MHTRYELFCLFLTERSSRGLLVASRTLGVGCLSDSRGWLPLGLSGFGRRGGTLCLTPLAGLGYGCQSFGCRRNACPGRDPHSKARCAAVRGGCLCAASRRGTLSLNPKPNRTPGREPKSQRDDASPALGLRGVARGDRLRFTAIVCISQLRLNRFPRWEPLAKVDSAASGRDPKPNLNPIRTPRRDLVRARRRESSLRYWYAA